MSLPAGGAAAAKQKDPLGLRPPQRVTWLLGGRGRIPCPQRNSAPAITAPPPGWRNDMGAIGACQADCSPQGSASRSRAGRTRKRSVVRSMSRISRNGARSMLEGRFPGGAAFAQSAVRGVTTISARCGSGSRDSERRGSYAALGSASIRPMAADTPRQRACPAGQATDWRSTSVPVRRTPSRSHSLPSRSTSGPSIPTPPPVRSRKATGRTHRGPAPLNW